MLSSRTPGSLLLDEATSALDSESELEVQNGLDALVRNRTVIAVAHRLSTIVGFDRVIVVERGRIIEDGPPQQLLRQKDGAFRQLWLLQVEGLDQSSPGLDFAAASGRFRGRVDGTRAHAAPCDADRLEQHGRPRLRGHCSRVLQRRAGQAGARSRSRIGRSKRRYDSRATVIVEARKPVRKSGFLAISWSMRSRSSTISVTIWIGTCQRYVP